MNLLQGKTAIVTGAARGIGEAVALKFATHGCLVELGVGVQNRQQFQHHSESPATAFVPNE